MFKIKSTKTIIKYTVYKMCSAFFDCYNNNIFLIREAVIIIVYHTNNIKT